MSRRILVAGERSVTYHVHHKGITTYGEASHAVELGRFLGPSSGAAGSPEFLAWDAYDRFWNNLLGWLAGDG